MRLAGCNLRCSYCDTAYALSAGQAEEWLTAEEILRRLAVYPWKLLTLTGGEPLLHQAGPLIEKLCAAGYEVNVETNGAVLLAQDRPESCFYTMDYKTGSSGMKERMELRNFALLKKRDVVKFVVGCRTDLEEMAAVTEKYFSAAGEQPAFFVSPVWGKIEPKEIVEFLRKKKLSRVRLQVQLHKIVWDAEERGV